MALLCCVRPPCGKVLLLQTFRPADAIASMIAINL